MKAVRLVSSGKPGVLSCGEVADPVAGAGEVVVEVRACGLNHLDLWLEEGALPLPSQLPRIPGCEVAGVVREAGTEVQGWSAGDAVALQSNLFCGGCEFCRRGRESLCLNGELLGVQRDGGLAERVVVPARALVRMPPGVDFRSSAALTLAGSTAMHMLTKRARVNPGDWVLVMGAASGVGSAAIQIARQLGARVITTASTEVKRRLGLELGAEQVVDVRQENWAVEVRRLTGRRGVDLVVEHLGGKILQQAFNCLARGGTIVTCGATTGREVGFNLWPFFVKEQQLVGSYGRDRTDMEETLTWAAAGRLRPVIDRELPLERAAEGYAALRAGQVLGKVIVVP